MADFGIWGWVILAVGGAAILFGSSRIPQVGRAMGKFVGQFKAGRLEAEKEVRALENELKQGGAPPAG